MPLKLTNFETKGQVAALNKWADGIETQLHGNSTAVAFVTQAVSTMPVDTTKIYDIIFSLGGRPNGSFTYPWLVFVRTVNFSTNFAGSQGKVLTNPTSSYTITIKKNGASFGTITISTGGVFTFVSSGSTTVASGDYFTVVTPASDPTLTGLMFTLKGSNG